MSIPIRGKSVYLFVVWSFLLFGLFVFFLLFGQGACVFFAVWAGACSFFAVWAGGVLFFLLFGPGACFFFFVWAGDGSSLTYPSAWLVFKRPNNKRDRTAKKKRVPPIRMRMRDDPWSSRKVWPNIWRRASGTPNMQPLARARLTQR